MNKQALARELKVARAKKGYTQGELAKKSGVSKCAIAFIEAECSTRLPRVTTLAKLQIALGLTDNELIKYLD